MSDPENTPDPTPTTENSPSLDLSDLKLVPDWVANFGSSQSLSKFEGKTGEDRRGGRRGSGPPRGDRRGPGGPGGDRRRGGGGGPPQGDRDRDRGRDSRGPRGKGKGFGKGQRGDDRPRGPRYEIPRDVTVTIEPSDAALDALAAHVRSAIQAFSMFDASRLVLSGGERHRAKISCAAERKTGLFGVTEGGGLYLTREEALSHALTKDLMAKYYREEQYEKEEPKGIFTAIGVCGFSGTLIGPPNHHSYQNNIRKIHRERFSNMSVEDYKRRIKVENDPEFVEKWKEQEKSGHRWTYLPSEEGEDAKPLVFENRVDVEGHFRRTHGDEVIRELREVVVGGDVAKDRLAPGLGVLIRQAVERAQRHLFEMSQKLSAGLERRGLKTFKRRSGKFYISRVRPRAIPDGLVFADRLAEIVAMLKNGTGMKTKDILETLAPSPPADADPGALAESKPKPDPVEGEPKLTTEQLSVLKDLHWLANEGYVIEYSDGMVFLGVQGDPNKPKAKKKKAAAPAESTPDSESKAPADEKQGEAAAAPESPKPDSTPTETEPTSPPEEKPASPESKPSEEPVPEPAAEPEPAPVVEPEPTPPASEADASAEAPPPVEAPPPTTSTATPTDEAPPADTESTTPTNE